MTEETIEVEEVSSDSRHRSFPHINQYRNTVKLASERASFDGVPLPILAFVGSVKLHGTNAGVTWTADGEMLVQSRSNIITVENDNNRFAAFVQENRSVFGQLAKPGRAIYGEWCGGNIQKGVALSQLPRMFVVFAIRDGEEWLTPQHILGIMPAALKCIYHFPHWFRQVDFNCPELSQNMFGEMTTEVERECPVGRELGAIGVGEGIVWWPMPNANFNVEGLQFKVKGEKHSETKVKTLAAVDLEKVENVRALVESIVTENRLEQKFIQSGLEADIRKTGDFLKIVAADVMREEGDTIAASGIPLTDVMRGVSLATKAWWMVKVNTV